MHDSEGNCYCQDSCGCVAPVFLEANSTVVVRNFVNEYPEQCVDEEVQVDTFLRSTNWMVEIDGIRYPVWLEGAEIEGVFTIGS